MSLFSYKPKTKFNKFAIGQNNHEVMYLKDRANKDGTCYPAIGTIAKDLKLSRRTVQRAVAGPDILSRNSSGEKTVEKAAYSLR